MLKTLAFVTVIVVTLFTLALPVQATNILFDATLSGAQEASPTGSTATGFGTVLLDDVADTIKVNLSWTSLVGGPATAAHIQGPAPIGLNAGVLFAFVGVPNTTSGFIPEQTFAISLTEIAELEADLLYFNIHNATFPGGEIRGQISATTAPVPEPATLFLVGSGLVGVLGLRKKLKK